MKISNSIIIHTLLCSITAIIIVIAFSNAFQRNQDKQHEFDTNLVILRDYNHLQHSAQQWLTLSDLIIGSGETYLINGTLKQSQVLLELVEAINQYLAGINSQSITETLSILINKNSQRIKKTENLDFDEEPEAYYALLDELDDDSKIFKTTLSELKERLKSNIAQQKLQLVEERSRLQSIAWLVGCFYLLTVFLSWYWQSNLLVKPIQNLTLAARKALMEDASIKLEKTGSIEIKELTQHIDKFVSTLETKIKDRTKELEARKKELELENSHRKKAESSAIKAQQKAEAASLAKSEFLATMSHEIRTPMNGVLGMTELLMASNLDTNQAHLASTAYRSAENLLSIINDILDFSKIETGQLELYDVDFELIQSIEDVIETVATSAHHKNIEMVSDLDHGEANIVRGDESRLRQVLINLLGNAIKFTEIGEVRLTQRILKHNLDGRIEVSFEISDTGIGIPEEKRALIFDAFVQSDNSISRKFGGTGLGLAISHKLIDTMGGTLEVDSQVGVGSCFKFTIELEEVACIVHSQPLPKQFHGLRVLCVDDHPTNREILHNQLTDWGMLCSNTGSPNEALEWLEVAASEEDPFRLVLLDWNMPKIKDSELSQKVMSNPDLPIILMSSAYLTTEDLSTGSGIKARLTKPIRGSQLFECIKNVLNESAQKLPVQIQPNQSKKPNAQGPKFNAAILVAEDNPVNQEVAKATLKMLGCSVTIVENGQQAVDIMEQSNFDLVLMDCHMPEVDGFEATRKIRKRERDRSQARTPIIALTADVGKGMPELCTEVGMDNYLTKPFQLQTLSAELSKWLTMSHEPDITNNLIETYHIDELRELSTACGQGLRGNIVTAFCGYVPKLLTTVHVTFEQQDWKELGNAVHSLKSACANIGAVHLSKLCSDIELAVREERQIHAVQIEEIERQLNKVLCELKEFNNGSQQKIRSIVGQ